MNKTIKKTSFAVAIFVLALIVLAATVVAVPQTAYAAPDVELPFTLVAPKNVTITKADGDSPTTMGYAFSISNEMNDFFAGYENAANAGTLPQYLTSKGVTYADEMWMLVQIDWALDDVDDEVSGWHYNEYWNAAPHGSLGQDADGKYHFSTWDVVNMGVNTSQTVTETWLYRGFNESEWLGGENFVGLKDQLRTSQYTFENYQEYGDVNLSIDWDRHTIYNRSRFVVVLRDEDEYAVADSFVFSDWSAVTAYGKDAEKVEPLKPGDVVAPTITGLKMTEEKFNDNPVVAFTLTVPETVAEQKARVAAANGTFRVEVEARVKGTSEWKDLNVAGDVTTGELTAALLYLAEPGKPVAAGTEIELRARYFVEQAGQDGFYSAYSKVIGFGSDDIVINDTPATDNNGDDGEGSILDKLPKSDCPICHFCPQPLGLCIFIWLIIIVAVIAVVVVVVVLVKKKKNKADKENK